MAKNQKQNPENDKVFIYIPTTLHKTFIDLAQVLLLFQSGFVSEDVYEKLRKMLAETSMAMSAIESSDVKQLITKDIEILAAQSDKLYDEYKHIIG